MLDNVKIIGVRMSAILTAIIMLTLFAGAGYAAWLTLIEETSSVEITSNEPLTYTSNFASNTLDTSEGADTDTDSIILHNNDGDQDLVLSYEITKSDIVDNCTDWENDLDISIFYDSNPVSNGTVITVPGGSNKELAVQYDAVKFSCPQTAQVDVRLISNG